MENGTNSQSKNIKLNNNEITTTILYGLIVIFTTPICIITIKELIKMSKIHKNFRFIVINLLLAYLFSIVLSSFRMISYFVPIEKVYTKTIDKIHWTSLYAISISVAFFVVERIIALIFVKTYEHFNKNLPILGMVFSIISWSVSASFQLLYKFKIVNDFHTILFTGSLQIIIIICYVLFFFYKIFKLKKNIDHSLSKRYQEEENLKSASLLKYILSFTVLAATYNIVFYIIYVRYNFYKYGGGFSLLTFQVPQLIQVMTTAIVILIQQRVFYRIFIKIAIILCKSNKVCIEDKHYSLQKSRINAIDLSGNSERTNVYFNSLQSVWKLNKTT